MCIEKLPAAQLRKAAPIEQAHPAAERRRRPREGACPPPQRTAHTAAVRCAGRLIRHATPALCPPPIADTE